MNRPLESATQDRIAPAFARQPPLYRQPRCAYSSKYPPRWPVVLRPLSTFRCTARITTQRHAPAPRTHARSILLSGVRPPLLPSQTACPSAPASSAMLPAIFTHPLSAVEYPHRNKASRSSASDPAIRDDCCGSVLLLRTPTRLPWSGTPTRAPSPTGCAMHHALQNSACRNTTLAPINAPR
jgi:hypothetical protein